MSTQFFYSQRKRCSLAKFLNQNEFFLFSFSKMWLWKREKLTYTYMHMCVYIYNESNIFFKNSFVWLLRHYYLWIKEWPECLDFKVVAFIVDISSTLQQERRQRAGYCHMLVLKSQRHRTLSVSDLVVYSMLSHFHKPAPTEGLWLLHHRTKWKSNCSQSPANEIHLFYLVIVAVWLY